MRNTNINAMDLTIVSTCDIFGSLMFLWPVIKQIEIKNTHGITNFEGSYEVDGARP
jgi:hypothetical protein